MEHIIANLLNAFESGKISRRQLIQSLALAATAASAADAATPAAAGKSFKATGVNHITYRVADYARTRDFYSDLLGMKVTRDGGKYCYLSFGDTLLVVANITDPKPPFYDHIAYTIENYNHQEVELELTRRGLNPKPDPAEPGVSFFINDPEGTRIQISKKR